MAGLSGAQRAPWYKVVSDSWDAWYAAEDDPDVSPDSLPRRTLCGGCRYYDEYPTGEYGGGPYEGGCTHPIGEPVAERQGEYVWEGGDCWGFKPEPGLTLEQFIAGERTPARRKRLGR